MRFFKGILISGITTVACMGIAMFENKQMVIKADVLSHLNTIDDVVDLFPSTVAHIEAMIERYIERASHDIQAIIDVPDDKRTFVNTARAFDHVSHFCDLAIGLNVCLTLESLSSNKDMRDAAYKGMMKAQHFYVDAVESNKNLFNAFKAYAQGNALSEQLTSEQRYFLKKTMDDFKRAGLDLPDDKIELVRIVKKELTELALVFERNIAEDNRTIEIEPLALKGVDAHFLASLKRTARGDYIVGIDYPTRSAIMENCIVEDTRHRYFNVYTSCAYPVNDDILKQIIAKRDQLARLLNFTSYAQLDTDDQMVKNPETAYAFLYDLVERANIKEREELRQWLCDKPESVELDKEGRIKPWDISYVQEHYKKGHFAVDEELISHYFPMEKTLQGLLDIYQQFLLLTFKEIAVTGLWHDDVTCIAVFDKNKQIIGYILMDLYPRDNKYKHAAHDTLIPALLCSDSEDENRRVVPAVSVVMANFPKSTKERPALLKRDDVRTFFHEFGHALHAMCGATQMASCAGTAVKRDFVEMPSQMLEEWLFDKEILRKVSGHYLTGEPLPDNMIDTIVALQAYDSGFLVKRYAFFSLISLDYFGPGEYKDPYLLWQTLYGKIHPEVVLVPHYGYASFGHLTCYGAKTYGYLWSKVFACDLFDTIQKQGLLNPVIGQRYVDQVIGKGGSQDPNELLRAFLGREPRSDAFFNRMGLK